MKTIKGHLPESVYKPAPGHVLCDYKKSSSKKIFFSIVGIQLEEVALVRLFQEKEMNAILKQKCYQLVYDTQISAGESTEFVHMYADLSSLIIKEYTEVQLLVINHPEKLIAMLYNDDLSAMINILLSTPTISRHDKNKFLGYNLR